MVKVVTTVGTFGHFTGRCYVPEICTILLPLRCSFRWYPFLRTFFWLPKMKPWTIVHGFWPENENFDFGYKRFHLKEHLKGSRIVHISVS